MFNTIRDEQKMKVDVILWDYDGTLVNSAQKNIDITKQILSVVAPRLTGNNLPKYLKSENSYHRANHQAKNWQNLYIDYYGMTEREMLDAGNLWTKYQLENETPVKLFSGIKQTINQVSLPQGICSQNSSENIKRVLKKNNLFHKFNSIVGYDDIPHNEQKPSPFSGIKCLGEIFNTLKNKMIVYIGDHESDVEFARNIDDELSESSRVISIIATYSGSDTKSWIHKPDFEIASPIDLFKILK